MKFQKEYHIHPCHKERRTIFQNTMEEKSIAILFSQTPKQYSHDIDYRFRQDSDFFYLSGFEEESSILVITKNEVRMYLRPIDAEKETWFGLMMGVERAPAELSVDAAFPVLEFWNHLPDLLKGKDLLYYFYGKNPEYDSKIFKTASTLFMRSRKGEIGPSKLVHLASILHPMRMIKSTYEIELMKHSIVATHNAHVALMKQSRPGMYEYQLDAIIHHEFRKENATEAYPSIVAGGPNATILHYTENNRLLQKEDLVLVDAGAEKNYMTSDVTRTFPVSGKFTSEQKELYQAVLDSQKYAISLVKAGNTVMGIHLLTARKLAESMIHLKLLKGSVDSLIEEGTYTKFYMHKSGHYLGIDVHDVGPYFHEEDAIPLKPGMVITVEPGLYISPAEETAPVHFRGIGIRIEDDILVTQNEPENLTASIPKEIKEIER